MLTWYGPDGDRVDLTGKVASNWIIKAANLLAMELACEPGSTVWVDLPAHWRSLVWAHAAWCTGARVTLTGEDADIVVTASPRDEQSHLEMVVIALPSLARRVEDLPPGAVDGAADLMTQPDAFILPPAADPGGETGLGSSQGELISGPAPVRPRGTQAGTGLDPAERRVLVAGPTAAELLHVIPPLWAAGASVVIADDDGVAESEGVTHVWEW